MTLTIVRGVAGKAAHQGKVGGLGSANHQGSSPDKSSPGTTQVSGAAVATGASGDAAVANVRSRSGSQATEKVREFKSARQLADSVADDVLVSDESLEVHGHLGEASTRQHLL